MQRAMHDQEKPANDADLCASNRVGLAVTLVFLIVSFVVVRKLQVRVLLETCMQTQSPGCELTVDRLRVSRFLDRIVTWH